MSPRFRLPLAVAAGHWRRRLQPTPNRATGCSASGMSPDQSKAEKPQYSRDCTKAKALFIVVDDDISPTFSRTYMLSNNIGQRELLLAWPFIIGLTSEPYSGGKERIGNVDVLPPTLSLQCTSNPERRVPPVHRRGRQLHDVSRSE